MNNYYTAAEAIKKLKVPRSTFYHLIKIGDIPEGIVVPLRKQALYPKQEIDKLVQERARYLEDVKQTPERLRLMVPNREDLVQLAEIDRMVFHEETLIAPDEQMKRFAYNPECIQVLKDTTTNTVLGGMTISPLKQNVLRKLINLEIDETEIKPEDYRPYRTDKPQDCYVVAIIARPGMMEKYYAAWLLRAGVDYLIELLERGIIIEHIYTVATTEEGEQLAESLGFTGLPAEKLDLEHEEFRRPYVLDLTTKENKSRLVQKYIQQRKNLERRQKRYRKQQLQKMT